MAVSTFCRRCGEHYNIRDGVAETPPGSRVSGIAGIRETPSGAIKSAREFLREAKALDESDEPQEFAETIATSVTPSKEEKKPEESEPSGEKDKDSVFHPEEIPKDAPDVNPIAAAMGGDQGEGEKKESADDFQEGEDHLDATHLGGEASDTSTKAGMFANLFDSSGTELSEPERPLDPSRMPTNYVPPGKRSRPGVQTRPVRCFECNHLQNVSIAATSTQCGRCSVYISLADKIIEIAHSQNIRTRGDVTVQKRGSLIGCDIACHNLIVLGKLSGSVDCSGDATFKNSGKVLGSMHCKHLFIDKKCELVFPQGIVAESADIHGVVTGNIICSGTIKIFKTGSVVGDARAKAVVLKDGGVLTGQMSIQHDIEIQLPHKKGYLEVHDYEPPSGKV